jgi:hypothetical protein
LGRIWTGTTKGLCCFDKRKDNFTSFDANDGLSSDQFNEQSAYRMLNGLFVYPTYKGFVIFKPEDLQSETTTVPVFISDFKILDKEYKPSKNPEEIDRLRLRYDQNFLNIQLVSPYYQNVDHVWYAYKLEGFDQEWIYTQNPLINYTNVPGGDYVFHYKASIDPSNWFVPERTLTMHVGTIYYKTVWFWIIIAVPFTNSTVLCLSFSKEKERTIVFIGNKSTAIGERKSIGAI